MDRNTAFEKVKAVIIDKLGCDESKVTDEALLIDDLKADSLDVVEMIMDLEEAFDISIVEEDDDSLERLKSVGDIVEYVLEQKA